jgi:alkanesulfonate monooxygenase SsuD/methylene tetrahydromethanopterin reductase-like flavin-dependent oxidoreductase (luciferase family)
MIGGGGEKKTLRFVAKYADACNPMGSPEDLAHKIDVLRRHCDDVGRDPNEIEVTTMFRNVAPDASADEIVRAAEAYAAVGVSTLVVAPMGDQPAAALEDTFGPVIGRIHEIQPKRL